MLARYQPYMDFVVYDAPNLCQWNGGRISRDIWLTEEMVAWFNDADIGVSLAFSNFEIDLNDTEGNRLLEMLKHDPRNGVILLNEDLRQYIRRNYPEYKLTFSIAGHPNRIDIDTALLNHYRDLENKYDKIVPRFEMALNPAFYDTAKHTQYEVMVNDTCIYGCRVLEEHMRAISEVNRTYKNPWKEIPIAVAAKVEECWIKNFDPDEGRERDQIKHGDTLGMDYTEKMYLRALEIGYTNFKIMGRELDTLSLRDDIIEHIEKLHKAMQHV